MPVLLVLLFVVVPLAELYVLIQVGQVIGTPWTIAILLADSILGSLLMKSQGRRAWRRFQAATGEGRIPHREVLDGVLVVFGGALLLTPGFLTDVLGLLLLVPATRALVRRGLARLISHRVVAGVAGPSGAALYAGGRGLWRRRGGRASRAPDVDGTAHDRAAPDGPPRAGRAADASRRSHGEGPPRLPG